MKDRILVGFSTMQGRQNKIPSEVTDLEVDGLKQALNIQVIMHDFCKYMHF